MPPRGSRRPQCHVVVVAAESETHGRVSRAKGFLAPLCPPLSEVELFRSPSVRYPQTSWLPPNSTLISLPGFYTESGARIGLLGVCRDNGRILLANSKPLSFSTLIFSPAQERLD